MHNYHAHKFRRLTGAKLINFIQQKNVMPPQFLIIPGVYIHSKNSDASWSQFILQLFFRWIREVSKNLAYTNGHTYQFDIIVVGESMY